MRFISYREQGMQTVVRYCAARDPSLKEDFALGVPRARFETLFPSILSEQFEPIKPTE